MGAIDSKKSTCNLGEIIPGVKISIEDKFGKKYIIGQCKISLFDLQCLIESDEELKGIALEDLMDKVYEGDKKYTQKLQDFLNDGCPMG